MLSGPRVAKGLIKKLTGFRGQMNWESFHLFAHWLCEHKYWWQLEKNQEQFCTRVEWLTKVFDCSEQLLWSDTFLEPYALILG